MTIRISRNCLCMVAVACSAGVMYAAAAGVAQPIKTVVADAARPLPLTAVRLTGGPLKVAQDLNGKYLLSLEPDRMLAYYRVRAGLEPKAQGLSRMGW